MSSQSTIVSRMREPDPEWRVLLVDDDATQRKLCQARLEAAGFRVEAAASAADGLVKALRAVPDVIVSDVLMPELDGFGFCRRVRGEASLAAVPILLLSSHYGSDADHDLARRVGASALVERTAEFDAELEAIHGALAESALPPPAPPDPALYEQHLRTNANQLTRLVVQAKSAEARYRTLFQNASDAITVLTPEGVVLDANEKWRRILGLAPEELIGRHVRDFAAPGYEDANSEAYRRAVEQGSERVEAVAMRGPSGATIYMDFSSSLIQLDGRQLVLTIGRDVTERMLAARALEAAEQKYRSLVERIPDVLWKVDGAGNIVFITSNVEQVCGYTAEEMMSQDADARASCVHPDDRQRVREAFQATVSSRRPFDLEYRRLRKDGSWMWVRNRTISSTQDGDGCFDGMLSDVTEKRRLEESLTHAQKMEAIGQLTGGIAHDFNNILAAIVTNTHFLLDALAQQDPRRADAEEIKLGAERAAALTRQLLAFSRRQVLNPSTVDLNVAVGGLEKMLRRLIGEDIEVAFVPGEGLGCVRVDVGQIEQVIMNLAVNARDAMPTGGKLSIETANVEVDERLARQIHCAPGSFVLLTVRDTGCGMDAETRRRIFEPFFTTKAPGKGTGLGLSTSYGIIKQSDGGISVTSEPGQGAAFHVYLPRVAVAATPVVNPRTRPVAALGGTETVLLIEDDVRLRAAVGRVLTARGYTLLVAGNPEQAMAVAKLHEAPIDLILSDVILPGSSGPEIVERVRAHHPEAITLFMSGYTDHAVLRSEGLQTGTNFIQKPFAPDALAKKVRELLERIPEVEPGDETRRHAS